MNRRYIRSLANVCYNFSKHRFVTTTKLETKFHGIADVDGKTRYLHYLDVGNMLDENPIIFVGGTAQTISSFGPHIRPFSRNRRLIVVETRGQGKTDLLSQYSSLSQIVEDFREFLVAVVGSKKVDLVGFSFGGRVCLAFSSHLPHLVRKVSITGVPLVRAPLGIAILDSWRDGLKKGEMTSCAWSFIINGYGEEFIKTYQHRLNQFVDIVSKANDPKKLSNLLQNSHVNDKNDYYSIESCCKRIENPTQVIGAVEDRLSALNSVEELSRAISGSVFISCSGGHLLPFENPHQWRALVLDFLK